MDQDLLYSDHTFNLESAGSKFSNADDKFVRGVVSVKLRNAIRAGRELEEAVLDGEEDEEREVDDEDDEERQDDDEEEEDDN